MNAKNRLHNMEVEEISLVHRPANKQKFLIVKGMDGDETALEMVPRDEGGFTLVEKEEGVPPDTETQGAPTLKLTKDVKAGLLESATAALEKLTEFTKSLEAAEEVEKEEDVIGDVSSLIQGVKSTTEALTEKACATPPKKKKEPAMKAWTCPACGYEGEPGKNGECPKCGKTMIQKAADAHQALLDEKLAAVSTLASDIAKNAATMDAKDLNVKIEQLSSMGWKIREDAQVVNVSKADVAAELKTLTDEIDKMLPRGIEPGTREDLNAGAGTIPDGSGVPLMSAAEMFSKIEGLAQVMKLRDENEKLEKRIAELEEGIKKSKVTKSIGLPNSGPVEKRDNHGGFQGWPLDMNSKY